MSKNYGDGSIYQRSDGRWVAKYTPLNSTKKKYIYGKTEKDVRKKLRAFKEDSNKHNPSEVNRTDLATYLREWLNNEYAPSVKSKTLDTKEYVIEKLIIPNIGDMQVGGIKRQDIQSLIKKLYDEKYSYSTISKVKVTLNQRFAKGLLDGDISNNPCQGVTLPKKIHQDTGKIKFFTEDNIKDIINAANAKYPNGTPIYRLGGIYQFLAYSGLRIGEALALEWKDVDFDKKTISVYKDVVRSKNRNGSGYIVTVQNTPKTSSSTRVIPMSKKAAEALNDIKKITGDNRYIFSSKSGQILSHRQIDRSFKGVLSRAGIDDTAGVHSLRHTFASMLIKNGVDIKVVSELLGHASVDVTYSIYVHIIQEQKVKAISVLDEL